MAHRGVSPQLRIGPQDGPETVITTPGGLEGRAFAAGSARMLTPAEVIARYGTAVDSKNYGVRVVPAPDWVHVGTPIDHASPAPATARATSDSEKGK